MIEDLTKEKLRKYGFDEESIENLFTRKNHECIYGEFFASNIDNKIYSGFDGEVKHFSKSLNNNENYIKANKLIQERHELENLLRDYKNSFEIAEQSIEREKKIAEKGFRNTYSVELRRKVEIQKELIRTQKALDKINDEIETIKLVESLNKNTKAIALRLSEQLKVNKVEDDKKRQEQKQKDYERCIEQNYNYSPNLDDFKEKAQILKLQSLSEYLVFLRTAKETYSNAKYYFLKWGDGLNVAIPTYKTYELIVNFASDEITKGLTKTKDKKEKGKSYSHKQIAIAYFVMKKSITKENAAEILNKHSENKSVDKLQQKLITKNNQLTSTFGNKSTNTKHLNDLVAAKRLISGMKIKPALSDLDLIITAFKANCEKGE